MYKRTSLALVAATLLASVSAASAAVQSSSTIPAMQSQGTYSIPTQPARDTLNLSTVQQSTAWNDLQGKAQEQTGPTGFHAAVGATVPSTIDLKLIPNKAANDVPALKPYDFAMVKSHILIVNPTDRKVVGVMSDVTGT
jgi:Protein of unknown function (DUF1236)